VKSSGFFKPRETHAKPQSSYFYYASSLASLGWLEVGWLGLACFAFSHLKFVFYGVFFSLAFSSYLEFTFWKVWFFLFFLS
jgi:hypothetical protein